ncbi:sugar ABC transporter ATP-binding protein [Paramicrobacterium agarici]|uniref:Rhamnose transport system ATP-binding protein n=1 Tax=Paramicrobacterium agarici TaxID=630514 RepID=A0A2A9DRM6_9MICO|nr:sugar ABC transporter ATP-binding protein [Microbacterium agarici]PFG29328.1 rhamnose transport system ATP-binding protein [Microbacterium agarici]TQO22330.1 rhamnose transport system ATP-binding protein [Microbacterium agarici]
MTIPAPSPVLELRDVRKTFGSVVALDSGSLTVLPGSIHALVGENGAGKSTLVKVIAGVHRRDAGSVTLGGENVDFTSTAEAKNAGVAVIYQEPTLFPDLSVAENVFMGRQPVRAGRAIDRSVMNAETTKLFERLGVSIDPTRPALGLSIADQQVLEIAKAISLDARVLVMDEPTAALSGVEVTRLFTIARALRDEGRGIVFISHRFDEIFELCDTVTVMRDGAYVSTHRVDDVTPAEIVTSMVGRDVDTLFPKTEGTEAGNVVLSVDGLTSPGVFSDVNFTVREREIVGLAGLVGAGRSEIARAVFGIDGYSAGVVRIDGATLAKGNPRKAIKAGIGLVPEDRRQQGLIVDMSVARNMTLVIRRALARWGLMSSGREYERAREGAARLRVKAGDLDSEAGTMSGGNQQKVVLAKWLETKPRLLIVDEPTRGIDVGTKAEVHRLLDELAQQGMAILMISSELPEVLGMSDRVLVVREGRITAELSRSEATSEAVMTAATRTGEAA